MVQETIDLLEAILPHTQFDAGRSGVFSLEKLRAIHEHDKLSGNMTAASAKAVIPSNLLERFVRQLRPLLKDYTEPGGDWVGNGLAHLMGGTRGIALTEFAHVLVRAAATLGAERAVQTLFTWIDGKSIHYRSKVLLSGAVVDEPLKLQEGIEIARLPTSTNELLAHLPAHSAMFHGYHDFLGGVVLSIDCKAEPALYKPQGKDLFREDVKRTWAQGELAGLSPDVFCQALSLACNNCISSKYSWHDFGDLNEFNPGMGNGLSWTDAPGSFHPSFMRATVNLSQEHLIQAKDIYLDLQAKTQDGKEIHTAVDRWMKSKYSTIVLPNRSILGRSLPDCFIELRIALDALYLKGITGELKFRLKFCILPYQPPTTFEPRQP